MDTIEWKIVDGGVKIYRRTWDGIDRPEHTTLCILTFSQFKSMIRQMSSEIRNLESKEKEELVHQRAVFLQDRNNAELALKEIDKKLSEYL